MMRQPRDAITTMRLAAAQEIACLRERSVVITLFGFAPSTAQ
jgi:hypothetical protein